MVADHMELEATRVASCVIPAIREAPVPVKEQRES